MQSGLRARLYEILETGRTGDKASSLVDSFIIILILLNVVAFALETVDSIHAQFGFWLEILNIVSVLIFTVEYAARLWVCVEAPYLRHLTPVKARMKFATGVMPVIDFLAIAPFYLGFFFAADLRILRVLRLLRFFKIARYSPALMTLLQVLKAERLSLFGALIIMCSLLLFASTGMYLIERDVQPDAFGSVPAAAWWALATLTTVGYGDVVPITPLGRVFGSLFMVFGLGMFALPVGIIATGFSQEINRREFVVTWGMVAKVPLFAKLTGQEVTEVMSVLRASTYPEESIIFNRGEQAHSMFFIVSGEVSIGKEEGGSVTLDAGDYFGEMALLEKRLRQGDATAVTKCHLLVLDSGDFHHLVRHNETIAKHIRETIETRLSDF